MHTYQLDCVEAVNMFYAENLALPLCGLFAATSCITQI